MSKYLERKRSEYVKEFGTLSKDASKKFYTSIVGGVDAAPTQIIDKKAFDKVKGALEVVDKNFMPHFASEMVQKVALVGALATIGGSTIAAITEQNPELLQYSLASIPGFLTMLSAGSYKSRIEKEDSKIKTSLENYISKKHASSYLSGFEKLATDTGTRAFFNDPAEYLFGDKYNKIINDQQSEYISKQALMDFEDFGSVSYDALKDVAGDSSMDK